MYIEIFNVGFQYVWKQKERCNTKEKRKNGVC